MAFKYLLKSYILIITIFLFRKKVILSSQIKSFLFFPLSPRSSNLFTYFLNNEIQNWIPCSGDTFIFQRQWNTYWHLEKRNFTLQHYLIFPKVLCDNLICLCCVKMLQKLLNSYLATCCQLLTFLCLHIWVALWILYFEMERSSNRICCYITCWNFSVFIICAFLSFNKMHLPPKN